jgi:hypothetical protein
MLIANLLDEPQAAMPVAPLAPPPQGQPALPAPQHNGTAYYLFQGVGAAGWHFHGNEHPQRLQQDLQNSSQLDREAVIVVDVEPVCVDRLRRRYPDQPNLHAFGDVRTPAFAELASSCLSGCFRKPRQVV